MMDAKTGVEEKRVKSTIIRRRAKTEPEPSPAPVEVSVSSADIQAAPKSALEQTSSPGQSAITAQPAVSETSVPGIKGVKEKANAVDPSNINEIVNISKEKKKTLRRKSRDELDMEVIARAGGLRKAAELMTVAPERLERVFRPDKSFKKRKLVTRKEFRKTEITTPKAIKRVIRIEGTVSVGDLARRMGTKAGDVLKKLIGLGVMATINQFIDSDTALLLAQEFGYEVENVAFAESSLLEEKMALTKEGVPRPPIVTVMGHVDHGKTSLLDKIRTARVAAGEAGGITQHIGAYEVALPKGSVTFIDTPGHEAFTAMRARGAQVTDIVILVVAADDGIMPQTIEAIHHAKAAKVPIIVAANKIDKPEADMGRVERGLMEYGLISEKLGGDTMILPVSAKTGQGVPELLEMIILQSEVLELKANPDKRASGTIIEAKLDKGRGPVATVVVQDGTLKVGDIIVAGVTHGKVRALVNAVGNQVKEALPSQPVEVLGLSGVPLAGDTLHAVDTEEDAQKIGEHRAQKIKEIRHLSQAPSKLEDLYSKALQGEIPEVRLIIKADVQGTIEALREVIKKLSTEKVRVTILHAGVGAFTESDVMLAIASKAIIIGFSVRPDAKGRELAERDKIEVRSYDVIYDVVDDIRKAMLGTLKPTYQEKYVGRAEARQIFTVSKIGSIAGSFITNGKVVRTAHVRLIRDGKVLYTGKISSLKRFKEDAKEVSEGLECGIGIENYNDLKVGDAIECFQLEEIPTSL